MRGPLALLLVSVMLALACGTTPPPRTALDDEPPRLVNAFFGLDDALPDVAWRICAEAPGADGMPVTFTRRVIGSGWEGADVSPEAFTIVTRSGERKTPACATLAPAIEPSEGHTVLLIGDLGDAQEDPPMRVEVSGELPLQGGGDARGLEVEVTPLEDGPTLVLAVAFPAGAIESDCPAETEQLVMVLWAGGVQPTDGATQETHRRVYSVTTEVGARTPFALGNVNDRDNYIHLCLDSDSPASRVSASAGVLVNPRGDLNPETSQEVVR